MTEDEAKMKACCGASGGSMMGKCVGTECMAWRWDMKRNPDYSHHSAISFPQSLDAPQMFIKDTENGHCGLAGTA